MLWCNALVLIVFTLMPARGSGAGTNRIDPIVRAEKIYLQTRIRYEQERTNPHLMWQLGQACFELADIVDSSSRREKLANEGIDVCKAALERNPKLAAAQYYYALNLGQLARTKSIGALKLVSQMEAALKQTIKMDPQIDFAGPHRSLGLLYRDAPGWPASIGSRSKARQQLEKAVDLSNDFPENRLCLLESYLRWGERRALEANIKKVDALLARSRKKYSDSTWAVQWQDWERRWHELLKQFPPAK